MLRPAEGKRREGPAAGVAAAAQLRYAPVVRITPGANEIKQLLRFADPPAQTGQMNDFDVRSCIE